MKYEHKPYGTARFCRVVDKFGYSKMPGRELGRELTKWLSDIKNDRVADTEQNQLQFVSLCEEIAKRLESADETPFRPKKAFQKARTREFAGKTRSDFNRKGQSH